MNKDASEAPERHSNELTRDRSQSESNIRDRSQSKSNTRDRSQTKSNFDELISQPDEKDQRTSQQPPIMKKELSVTLAPIEPKDPNTVQDVYAFAGMHHIFDEHSQPVTNIQFANGDKNLLAFSSYDGKISICNSVNNPRRLRTLQHDEAVTDFAWSATNNMIISTSADKSIRVWQVRNGECIRVIPDEVATMSCSFHPLNHNVFVVGNEKGVLKVFDLSSGRCTKKENLEKAEMLLTYGDFTGGRFSKMTGLTYTYATTMCFNSSGTLLFVGDSKGFVRTYTFNDKNSNMSLIGKTAATKVGKSVSCVRFKECQMLLAPRDALLVNTNDGSVKVFWVQKIPTSNSQLVLEKSFPIKNKREPLRASFCPLITKREPIIVTGSENGSIYIFDKTRPQPCINELQGHAGTVYDVCWNNDESLLASCDSTGTVILWKRVLQVDDTKQEQWSD